MDTATKEEPIPSPCRKICVLGDDEVCTGCHRTIEEIARWMSMTDEEKRAVWKRLGPSIE